MKNYLAYAAKARARARVEYLKGMLVMGGFGMFIAGCVFYGVSA